MAWKVPCLERVAELLQESGLAVLARDPLGMLEAGDGLLRVRYYRGERHLEVAIAPDFCRWSNSVDFRRSLPRTVKRWRLLLAELRERARLRAPDLAWEKAPRPRCVRRCPGRFCRRGRGRR